VSVTTLLGTVTETGIAPSVSANVVTTITNGAVQVNGLSVSVSTGGAVSRLKVWNGSAFVPYQAKVWTGSAWVVKPVKVWNGSAWITYS
jgi:hypothetical protein